MKWYGSIEKQAQTVDPFGFKDPVAKPPTPSTPPDRRDRPNPRTVDREVNQFESTDPITRIMRFLGMMNQEQLAGLADNIGKMDHYTFLDLVSKGNQTQNQAGPTEPAGPATSRQVQQSDVAPVTPSRPFDRELPPKLKYLPKALEGTPSAKPGWQEGPKVEEGRDPKFDAWTRKQRGN